MQSNIALVCAGQGAQTVGMGRDLLESFPEGRALFDKASDTLGFDLARVCFEGPEADLLRSDICQPAIFTVSVICARALQARLPAAARSAGMAGLSLGEWTALHLAGAISLVDALEVLQVRGRFMQEACESEPGAMLSVIGLDPARLETLAAEAGVEVANFNSPEQTVLSGRREGIARAEQLAREAGAKRTLPLAVAGAYHSSLMMPAAEHLARFLVDVPLLAPTVPVLSNVTGRPHGGPEEIRQAMVAQVTSPVRWVDCVRYFEQQGIARYIECGPGKVLTGLIKRIAAGRPLLCNVQDAASLAATAQSLADA